MDYGPFMTLFASFLEFEIFLPIIGISADPTKPDWNFVKKVWWDIVEMVRDEKKESQPCQVIRMHISRSSEMTMAPQNFLGKFNWVLSFSFAALPHLVSLLEWHDFCQSVVETVSLNVDHSQVPIPIKFHWGKQWDIATMNGKLYLDYVKQVQSAQITKFKKDLKALAKLGGTKQRYNIKYFSNSVLDYILGESSKLPPSLVESVIKKRKKITKNARSRKGSISLASASSPAFSVVAKMELHGSSGDEGTRSPSPKGSPRFRDSE